MGTNYYLYEAEKPPCTCCGRPYTSTPRHIGKSSAGWCFMLHIYPEDNINTLEDWKREFNLEGRKILDEYGKEHSISAMLNNITNRAFPSPPDYFDKYSEPGPNNLMRLRVGPFCAGHGPGTYDYAVGDFS